MTARPGTATLRAANLIALCKGEARGEGSSDVFVFIDQTPLVIVRQQQQQQQQQQRILTVRGRHSIYTTSIRTTTIHVHIGGFNQRQGEALPPQIFFTLSRFVFTVQTRKIGSVYSQENYRNCCPLMSDFKAKKAPNSMSAGALPQSPLGELTALPHTPS